MPRTRKDEDLCFHCGGRGTQITATYPGTGAGRSSHPCTWCEGTGKKKPEPPPKKELLIF